VAQARPTFERRQLGLTLRRLREDAGETQLAASKAIGKVRSRVVQLEEGTATASQEDLIALLDFYHVSSPKERNNVLTLGAHTRRRQRKSSHFESLPDQYRRFEDFEESASGIDAFEHGIIPGILQSPLYIDALIAEGNGIFWDSGAVEPQERIEFRLERQNKVLHSPEPAVLRYAISEDALRANMGSPEVMRQQLQHLLNLADELSNLSIRVLPTNSYGNPIRGGGFQILDFGDRGPPIGLTSNAFGMSKYHMYSEEVSQMERAFNRIWDLALSDTRTKDHIKKLERKI
jgi:transcriptional regulator with XRE-family HTH domain